MTCRMARIAAATLALAATGGFSAARAQDATKSCVPAEHAEALLVNVLPGLLRELQDRCNTSLPPGALLRELPDDYLDPFVDAADAAWPEALLAMKRIGGGALAAGEAKETQAMLQSMIGPMILSGFQTRSCAGVDTLLTELRPLPPRNLAGAMIAILQMQGAEDEKSSLPICASEQS